jgi:hypothetical protein
MPTVPERNDSNPSPAADLVPRLGRLEADVTQLKLDVTQLKVDVAEIKATLPHLATKADLAGVKADLAGLESRLIRWMVGSWVAMAGLMTGVMTALIRFAH